jgi:hypothetical protein
MMLKLHRIQKEEAVYVVNPLKLDHNSSESPEDGQRLCEQILDTDVISFISMKWSHCSSEVQMDIFSKIAHVIGTADSLSQSGFVSAMQTLEKKSQVTPLKHTWDWDWHEMFGLKGPLSLSERH